MRLHVRAVLLALFLFSSGTFQGARAETVDLLLALVTDVSRSIDDQEFALQKNGYLAAFSDTRVIAAIKGGVMGAIAVNYIEFASAHEVRTVIGWTIIRDEASARAFADAVLAAPRSYWGRTAIGSGIDFAVKEMAASGHEATRRVIDVCGDGTNNAGRDMHGARDDAVAAGITVNGLVILSEPNNEWNAAHVRPPGGLKKYYADNVIGGPGSFVMQADDFKSFGEAMTRKLINEISSLPAVVKYSRTHVIPRPGNMAIMRRPRS